MLPKEAQMLRRHDNREPVFPQPVDADSPPGRFTLLTVVGDRAKLDGKFEITDSIQIDCEVDGELKVAGQLVIGESGVVHADVETVDAVIHGEYEGNMVATGDVEIMPTGRVSGDIKTDSLVISKGAFFIGNVTKIGEPERRSRVADQARPALYGGGPRDRAAVPVKGSPLDALIAEIRHQALQQERAEQK